MTDYNYRDDDMHQLLRSLLDTYPQPKMVELLNKTTVQQLSRVVEQYYSDTAKDVQYQLQLTTTRNNHTDALSTLHLVYARVRCVDATLGYEVWGCKSIAQDVTPTIAIRELLSGKRQHFTDPDSETPE